jgi:hypothetical protein
MDRARPRHIPIFPVAVVVAAVFLGLLLLIMSRVEDAKLRSMLLRVLIGGFVGGLALFTWISVEWGRRRRAVAGGRFSAGAAARIATETVFMGSPFADTSTCRRPRRIHLERSEIQAWKQVARTTGLALDRSRNLRLSGTIRGIEVRVDPVESDHYETRARAALPISLAGKVVADLDDAGSVRIAGAPADLEAALRDSPLVHWLTVSGDATLEIEAQGARAFAPDIIDDPDLLRALIELAVCAAEAVTAWQRKA